jgi:hypothetical protein
MLVRFVEAAAALGIENRFENTILVEKWRRRAIHLSAANDSTSVADAEQHRRRAIREIKRCPLSIGVDKSIFLSALQQRLATAWP